MDPEPEVLSTRHGPLVIATLNRPRALNALNTNMVETLLEQYRRWDAAEDVCCIVLKGSGPKAFCAGGDVKGAALEVKQGDFGKPLRFFRSEYALNYQLSVLTKPVVSLLDGIVMGGGAGVSLHGVFRVATDKTLFAMPECAIGLFPDVGASRFLSRLPGELGTYLALTGARLQGADMKRCGLATHYIPSDVLPRAEAALHALGPRARAVGAVDETLRAFEEAVAATDGITRQLPQIDECFAGSSVEEIRHALESAASDWSRSTLAAMEKGSPLSQKVSLRALRQGKGLPLASCLQMENRIVSRMVRGPSDFYEGVRAMLIDRGGAPRWSPPSLAQVTPSMVDAFFAPLPPEEELQLLASPAALPARL